MTEQVTLTLDDETKALYDEYLAISQQVKGALPAEICFKVGLKRGLQKLRLNLEQGKKPRRAIKNDTRPRPNKRQPYNKENTDE